MAYEVQRKLIDHQNGMMDVVTSKPPKNEPDLRGDPVQQAKMLSKHSNSICDLEPYNHSDLYCHLKAR